MLSVSYGLFGSNASVVPHPKSFLLRLFKTNYLSFCLIPLVIYVSQDSKGMKLAFTLPTLWVMCSGEHYWMCNPAQRQNHHIYWGLPNINPCTPRQTTFEPLWPVRLLSPRHSVVSQPHISAFQLFDYSQPWQLTGLTGTSWAVYTNIASSTSLLPG